MKNLKRFIVLGCLVLLLSGCKGNFTIKNKEINLLSGKHIVEMSIKNYGKVTLELDADVAPITVTNFIDLANSGFYDGNKIHRIDNDLGVIQGGEGLGNEATIKGEFLANGVENDISHVRGVISMARAGSVSDGYDTASTQFFIVTKDASAIDNYYAAFGKVTKGMDVVDKVTKKKVKTDDMGMILNENDMPVIEYVKEIEE